MARILVLDGWSMERLSVLPSSELENTTNPSAWPSTLARTSPLQLK